MDLARQLLRQINDPTLSRDEIAMLRCRLARELEEAGNFEAARGAMGDLWSRIGEHPTLQGLGRRTAAEVLLRAGVLSGFLGGARQIEGAQEFAKDLISESAAIFTELDETEMVTEARIELAYCYWREGASDEARVTLRDALTLLGDVVNVQRAVALLRLAIVEASATRYNDALRILLEAGPLFDAVPSHAKKGKFHMNLAIVLKNLSIGEGREDYADRALVEYAAAGFHFEQAGHTRDLARIENNLGFLLLTLGRYKEAHGHLDRARRLFASLKDNGSVAGVDETRSRVLLAEGRVAEAERIMRVAVRTLEKGEEMAVLAEALTTYGTALARLGKQAEGRLMLERATALAEQSGDIEGAGLAALVIIEELAEHLTTNELRSIYERASPLLACSQHTATLHRLRACADKIVIAQYGRISKSPSPDFIYASEQIGEILRAAHRVAVSDGAVLITGETGTGKEVLARLIHSWSGRMGEFVAINCGALTDTLIESQLFGHRKGSFTDAIEDHPGAVRQAAGGTLFLDEVADLSAGNQGKLLRLIEHGEIHSIGDPLPEYIDVRIIAAANCDLKQRVSEKQFRDDLFYRLETFHLEIPPLRARPEDIPAIAEHFIKKATERYGKNVHFTAEALEAMKAMSLKGNARELQSLIERTMLIATEGSTITPEAVEVVSLRQTQMAGLANPWEGFSLKEEVRRLEDRFIEMALRDARGMVTIAARLLGFPHHETLNWRLRNRNKNAQSAKKSVEPRRRSIFGTARKKKS
jgi:transcriptional regulator with GAF, ATPase, and Fis domain/Flp pilus assembly protein TadD